MDQGWDSHGEAAAALARVVQGFGVPVLGQPDLLEGLLNDDIPQLPRETAMLTEAARQGMAGLLAQRLGQGVSAQAAITMVAGEVTARSAVDAAGARWAAKVFAEVAGDEPAATVAGTGQVASTGQGASTALTPPVGQVISTTPSTTPRRPGETDVTVLPEAAPTELVTADPASQGQPGLIIIAALAVGVAPVTRLFWALLPASPSGKAVFWTSALLLLAAGALAVTLAIRGRAGIEGPAAVLGAALPITALQILLTASAPGEQIVSQSTRALIELTTWIGLIAELAAIGLAVRALVRRHEIGRPSPDLLTLGVAAAGIAFPLTHLLAQDRFRHAGVYYLLGSDVSGANIIWSLLFIAFYLLPAAIALALPSASLAQPVSWAGWLAVTLAVQSVYSPTPGLNAAPGLYLSWLAWLAVLAGTWFLAARASGN